MRNVILFIKKNRLVLMVLGVLFFAHLTYISGGFVWLDHNDIEQKKAVVNLSQLPKAFLQVFGETSFYRPVVVTLNSIDYAIYGNHPKGWHVTNIVLQLLVTVVAIPFLTIFFKLTEKEKLLTMFFIGIHPVSILIVGSITHRQESILLLLMMLTVIFYTKLRLIGGLKNILFFTLFLSCSIFTKETALVVVPAILILWEIVSKQKIAIKSKNTFYKLTPWLVVTVVFMTYVIMRFFVVGATWGTSAPTLSVTDSLATRIVLVGKFALYLIYPLKPNFSDAVTVFHFNDIPVVVTLFSFFILLFFMYKKGFRSSISCALLLTGILLSPSANIVPVPRIGSPHYSYLAVVGMAGIIIVFTRMFTQTTVRFGYYFLYVWLVIASVVTFISGDQFKDDKSLFQPEVEKDQNFAEAYYYLGNYYLKQSEFASAQKSFENGLQQRFDVLVYRDEVSMRINLGTALLQQNKIDEAEDEYLVVQEIAPQQFKEYISFNLALIAHQKGENARAIDLLEQQELKIRNSCLFLANLYNIEGEKKREQETMDGCAYLEK